MSDQSTPTVATVAPNPLTPEQQRQRQMQAFLRAPVQKIYANGLGVNATATDISVVLLDNTNPVGILTLAYSTAKSLIIDVSTAIKTFEDRTGEKVKDINTLAAKLKETQK